LAQPGFTLIEVLVSVAAASIMMLALMQGVTQASRNWVTQTKAFSTQRELRTALRLLADDLAAAVPVRAAPIVPGVVAAPALRQQFILETPQDSYRSSKLAFFRAAPLSLQRETPEAEGDLELVFYGVAHTPRPSPTGVGDQVMTQKLVRRVLSPAETMNRLHNHLVELGPLITPEDWTALEKASDGTEILAEQVIRFQVRATANRPRPGQKFIADPIWNPANMPDAVQIALMVTNRETAGLLNTETDWRGHGNLSELITNSTPDDPLDDREANTLHMVVPMNRLP
jgi:prepilin-type N-terminal cleavage/methylation domain-containing protein